MFDSRSSNIRCPSRIFYIQQQSLAHRKEEKKRKGEAYGARAVPLFIVFARLGTSV